ncbi:MAG: toxin-activating lysine-acyltransferase [Alphaproteobacteria bacterium]|nr:MAG: toxin-activating lysine-acyltransferase [Alphaproteobacteria bacterium]
MSGLEPGEVGFDSRKILESLDPAQVGVALSKLFAASIGDMVVVLSRSPAHKHHFLADIEWMVLPAASSGQFYVVETAHKEHGFRAPIALVTWAFVSEEIDRRLAEQGDGPRARLRPDEWEGGEIAWLINAVGSFEGINAGLRWLRDGPFRERRIKLVVKAEKGRAKVQTLDDLMEAAKGAPV